MKKFVVLLCIALSLRVHAQVCLGNTTYASAELFDPAWIYGCSTGSSCSGAPTQLSNLAACEPVQPIEGCAPIPAGCGTDSKGSDLWFKFYAQADSALISVIQNTSFVASVQAFSGNPTCDSLVQIGCATAGGPSSGVQLSLHGLDVNEVYWFRVYGTANNSSQRTGNFCFCGSVGLSNQVLSSAFRYFSVQKDAGIANLKWKLDNVTSSDYFDIEKSTDGKQFESIARVDGQEGSQGNSYSFSDLYPHTGLNYYRIRRVDVSGNAEMSSIQAVQFGEEPEFRILQNPLADVLRIYARSGFTGAIFNINGEEFGTWSIVPGDNEIDATMLSPGCYFFRNTSNGEMQKFVVMR